MNQIPPKPQGVNWNDEQWQAIHQKGANILVSAGAGSGKTAVLVERLVTQMLDNSNPINVDEVLVVTFTDAAASEMKHRVRQKLLALQEKEPKNLNIQKQLQKLPTANISTFHAFCIKQIKKYYYVLGIDPNIKAIDPDLLRIYVEEVMQKMCDRWYKEKDENFLKLVNYYSTDYKDTIIKNMILQMYYQIVQLPYHDKWMEEILVSLDVKKLKEWKNYNLLITQILNLLDEGLMLCNKALRMCSEYSELCVYSETLIKEKNAIEDVVNSITDDTDYKTVESKIKSIVFDRLPRNTSEVDEELKKEFIGLRDGYKKLIIKDKILDGFFGYDEETNLKHFKENQEIISVIYNLTLEFKKELDSKKTTNNYIDFNDYEHLTLKLLVSSQEVREELKKKFKAIYVDEYQDTNYMQEEILSILNKGASKIFMVGDVKQAIYRFRHSTPKLFKSKYKNFKYKLEDIEYRAGEDEALVGLKIDLNKNYRSRKEVIDFTNYIFKNIMSEKLGEVKYDENAQLNFGATYFQNIPSPNRINITTIPKETNLCQTKDELETEALVSRIHELIQQDAKVSENGGKDLRKINYSDIAILTRNYSSSHSIIRVLEKYKIPYTIERDINFYETYEIKLVIAFLKLISNTHDEVALTATMRSLLYNFNETQLAQIRLINTDRNIKYYNIVLESDINLFPVEMRNQIKKLRQDIEEYQTLMSKVGVEEFIRTLYEKSGLLEIALTLKQGKVRRNNLLKLLEIATSYEKIEIGTLHNFISYVKHLEVVGTAEQITKDVENAVRIMSFHKSKGLEFPYVFILGLKKVFNLKDEKEVVLIDKDLGVASQIKDQYKEHVVYYKTLYQTLIKQQMRSENLSEEMRMLYVAFTRAKEHLEIICTDQKEKSLSFYGWLENPLSNSNESYIQKIQVDELPKVSNDVVDIEENANGEAFDIKQAVEKMNYQYKYIADTQTFAKTSISKMKDMVSTHSDTLAEESFTKTNELKKPKFLQTKALATEKGTAVHKLFSYLNYTKKYNEDDLSTIAHEMCEKDILTKEEVSYIDFSKVAKFFDTKLFSELQKALQVKTEAPFTTKLPAKDIYPNYTGTSNVILQGIIDLMIVFEDKVYIVDFKTNKIKNQKSKEDALKSYTLQMSIYKEAIKKFYKNKDVKTIIYFVDTNEIAEI